MSCDHLTYDPPYWRPDDYSSDPLAGEWVYPEPRGSYEDIDVGRYRCTQCGEVFYYTGLWREHWEGGRKLLDESTGIVKPKE